MVLVWTGSYFKSTESVVGKSLRLFSFGLTPVAPTFFLDISIYSGQPNLLLLHSDTTNGENN